MVKRGHMARRIDINRIIKSQFVRDLPFIIAGCAIAGFATDAFMVPNGLAAGGLTGLATIRYRQDSCALSDSP